jgi:lipopolysaccharide export system permease protein
MSLKIFNFPNSIISRYLLKSLVVILFSYFFYYWFDCFWKSICIDCSRECRAWNSYSGINANSWFNMLRDLPIILSLSFFLSIIISISQFYKNSEAVVMNSFGMGDKSFIHLIQPLVVFLFLLVFALTIYAVPWAKQQKSFAEDETVNASEFSFITEGKFESFKNGEIVFYASESSQIDEAGEQNMEEIFIYVSNETSSNCCIGF